MSDVLVTSSQPDMALQLSGGGGGGSIAIDLDTAALKITKCSLTNPSATRWMVLELLNSDETVKATYFANPGQNLAKQLVGVEQHDYTVAQNGGAAGNKTWRSYKHRIYFADTAPVVLNGLEWSGNESTTLERRIVFSNPFPIFDATYVFRVFPKKKTTGPNPRYYTTFFWGNNGVFEWNGGQPDTYYGGHPYPQPSPNGPGQWEISTFANDFLTGVEVEWDRWHTQVFRAWRESASITHYEFYWDWPDQTRLLEQTVDFPGWASTNPPNPSIVVGQAPNRGDGLSWGGFAGFEEFKGIIRGMQFYNSLLTLSQVTSEIASPGSAVTPWYLNLNPTVEDISDKSGNNHNPAWVGADRPTLWTG